MKATSSKSLFTANSMVYSTFCLLLTTSFFWSQTKAYDDSVKECWDIRLQNETYFCYGAVEWPISQDVYYDQYNRDERARAKYNTMKRNWESPKYKKQPGDDCFAISRSFYCSQEFPVCKDVEAQTQPMCDYICALWKFRCPDEEQCQAATADEVCSGGLNGFSSLFSTAIGGGLALAYLTGLL